MSLSSLHLEAFLSVAQTLNFTRAAKNLHITQSALSQRVLNLEAELETTLFIRDRAGLRLTEVAQELLRYCQFKSQHENEFLETLKNKDRAQVAGVLRIGGFSSVMGSVFLPAVSDLLQQNHRLRLEMSTRELYELPDLLKRGEVDYTLLTSRIERNEVENTLLGFEENVLVQRKNYSGNAVYLDHDESDEVTFSYFKKFGRPQKIRRHYLDDVYGIMDGVKAGLGQAVLPLHLIENEKLIEVLEPKKVLKIPIYLCYYKQPYYTNLHKAVCESIVSHSNKKLAKA